MIAPFKNYTPKIHGTAFVAPNASVIGRVEIGRGSSVWFGAVLRGDINRIRVGAGTNIQDNAVLHVEADLECRVGDRVVVGHQATVHACTVEDGALIGIGARVLNGARVGKGAIVAAGAVVLEGAVVPPNSLAVGVPAKVVRKLEKGEIEKTRRNAMRYTELASWYRENLTFSAGAQVMPLGDLSKFF